MSNITYSGKKGGWLDGGQASILEEEKVEIPDYISPEFILSECHKMAEHLDFLYIKERRKEVYDAIVSLNNTLESIETL